MQPVKVKPKNLIQNLKNIFVLNPIRNDRDKNTFSKNVIEMRTRSYERGEYQTWIYEEKKLLNDKVDVAAALGICVNLSEIKELLPYRTISSIRCKVRELLIKRGLQHLGTCTVKKAKGNKNGRTIK